MDDRVFSVEEVNAALQLASGTPTTRQLGAPSLRVWWTQADTADHVAALALGVLPDGWQWNPALDRYEGPGDGFIPVLNPLLGPKFRDWLEAVRSGQAEIACRLLAAHVELERLRAGGVK